MGRSGWLFAGRELGQVRAAASAFRYSHIDTHLCVKQLLIGARVLTLQAAVWVTACRRDGGHWRDWHWRPAAGGAATGAPPDRKLRCCWRLDLLLLLPGIQHVSGVDGCSGRGVAAVAVDKWAAVTS